MKKIELFLLAAATLFTASCNKSADVSLQAADTFEDAGGVPVTFNVKGVVTKATSTYTASLANEDKLDKNFQIIAYEEDSGGNAGALKTWYNRYNVGTLTSFTTAVLPGKTRFLFVCNQEKMLPQNCQDWEDRASIVTDTKTAFTSDHLPLGLGFDAPYYSRTVTAGTPMAFDVELIHMCSRIKLLSIVNEMTQDGRISEMKGKFISLLNVPKGLKMNGTVQETPYYNPKGEDFSTLQKCNASAGPRSYGDITYSGNTMDGPCVYTYPGSNLYLLVGVNFLFDGNTSEVTRYYAVPLGTLAMNKTYDVVLHVKNIGSSDPTDPAISSTDTFSVDVADWVAAEMIDEMM